MRAPLKLRQMEPNIAYLHELNLKIRNRQPLFIPIKERKYFKFALNSGLLSCESMLDVVTWLENDLVTPDTLAWQDIDPFYLGYLFGLKVPALSIPVLAQKTYQVNEVRIVSGAEIAGEKIKIASPVGELLFDDIPQSMLPVEAFTPPPRLEIRLKFSLGTSRMKSIRLTSISCGDLLLIQRPNPRVYIADKLAFRFNLSEEGNIMVEELEEYNEEDSEEENEEETAEAEEDIQAVDNESPGAVLKPKGRFDRNKINLKMNFLLQRQDMMLEEISNLHEGSLVKLFPDAEKNIIVMINNQRYAKGELIQIGDGLAVEVTEIYLTEDKGK